MADKLGGIYVDIEARLDKLNKAMNDAFEHSKATAGKIENTFRNLGSAIATGFSAYAAFDFLKDSLAEARQAAQSLAKVEQAIRTTGAAAGFTSDELKDMAGELERIAGIDGDKIMNDVTLQLLTFTNITGTSFKRAQQAVLDLSAVLGSDLLSQTIQLGKALENPVQGLTALQRVGITFTEAQKDQIKNLIDQNNLLGAQGIILTEIETKYGGQAKAMNDASGGAMSLSVAWGNLKEQVGNAIMPAIQALTGSLTQLSDETQKTSEVWTAVGGVFKVITGFVMALGTIVKEVAFGLGTIGAAAYALIQGKFSMAGDIVAKGWDKMKNAYTDYASTVDGMFASSEKANKGVTALGNAIAKIKQGGGKGEKSEITEIIEQEAKFTTQLGEIDKALKQTNLSEFTRNNLMLKRIEILKELHKYDKVFAIQKNGIGDVQAGGYMYRPDSARDGLAGLRDNEQAGIDKIMQDFTDAKQAAESFANSIANGFANAIVSGQGVVSMFKNIGAELLGMVIQATAFSLIMKAFGLPTVGGSGGGFGSLLGFSVQTPTGGSASAPMNAGFDKLNNSLQAMNVNMMSKGNAPVNIYMDGKIVATLTSKHQAQMAKGNVKV